MRQLSEDRHPGGFTLIEMLVVISVIAVLIALILPAIGKARASSRSAASSANARTLAQVIQTYCGDAKDAMPAFHAGQWYPAFNRDQQIMMPYFQVANMWTGVTFDYLPYNENIDVFLSPGSPRRNDASLNWPTSYHYSTSFVAVPELWAAGSVADPRFLQPGRLASTAFPSQKALLWDNDASFLRSARRSVTTGDLLERTPVAMTDVSVSLRTPGDATAPVVNAFLPPGASMRLHNTAMGQRGTDY